MNEKTTKQIEEMMNQTIGVEVEMNNITSTPQAATVTIPTPHGTARVESGSFRRT